MAQQVARRPQVVEVVDESRRRPLAVRGDHAGHLGDASRSPSTASSSATMPASPSPLSTQSIAPSPCSTIARAVNEALWPPTQMKHARQHRLRLLGEIDDLRDIGEVVAGERDEIRPPFRDQAAIVVVALDLQIDQPRPRARRGARPPPPARARAARAAETPSCTATGRGERTGAAWDYPWDYPMIGAPSRFKSQEGGVVPSPCPVTKPRHVLRRHRLSVSSFDFCSSLRLA